MSLIVNGQLVQEGVRAILQEGGLFTPNLRLDCGVCKSKEAPTPLCLNKTCCASAILANQPDFSEQMEWLEEAVVRAGHQIIFYPAFHCELNFIEPVWSYSKSQLRRSCSYSFADLEANFPLTLNNIPLATIRRYYRSCSRFMDLYRRGLHGPLLDFIMKKYSSHRKVPSFVDNALLLDSITAQFHRKSRKKP